MNFKIFVLFLALPYGINAAPFQMNPIIQKRPAVKHKVEKIKKTEKKALKICKKPLKQKNTPPAAIYANPRMVLLQQISNQILALRQERQQLEEKKRILLDAFAKTQSAFIFKLPPPQEIQHQQSLLLALSAESMSDFVHQSVMLPYLTRYLVQKNQQCVNLLHNIQRLNFCIQSNAQKEQELTNQWYKEKKLADSPTQK